MTKTISDRQLCISILGEILLHRGSLASAFGANLKSYPNNNTALVQEICYGVCRWFHLLDAVARELLEKPLRKKDNDVHCLLLVGLYQLFYMRTPAHAAINETVAEAETLGKVWAKNLVNAILRAAQRRQGELFEQAGKDYVGKYSHPEWMLSRIKKDWPASYRLILDSNNVRAPMTLRVNIGRTTRAEYLVELELAGIAAIPGTLTSTAVILDSPRDVNLLPGFSTGLVSVQDEASQLVASLLPLAPALKILDACAAPGGKTCALLEAEPLLNVTAIDKDARRISRINENLERLALNAVVTRGDICFDTNFSHDSFDRILLDVPCSATGVIRRHPDIKLLRTPDEVETLVKTQAELLQSAWPLLKSGGYLLYSTCSVFKEENSLQIARFVAATSNVEHVALTIPGSTSCDFGSQLFAKENGHDGFFYALLRKL
ncbi:MAG: 16S rRNA (cytosine(967)-C(5))-methyltransferase RsmB [Pseudomonadota bacterium]